MLYKLTYVWNLKQKKTKHWSHRKEVEGGERGPRGRWLRGTNPAVRQLSSGVVCHTQERKAWASSGKGEGIFLFFCLFVSNEKMDISWTSCNHFTMSVNQTIMLCTFNLYSNLSYFSVKWKIYRSWLQDLVVGMQRASLPTAHLGTALRLSLLVYLYLHLLKKITR